MAVFVGAQTVELAGRADGENAMDPSGDEEVDQLAQCLLVDLAIRGQGCDHGGQDAFGLETHGATSQSGP
ncbi:hypothetical protein SDC9_159004 [bioreactor metagenome]|uniref:Uncharacterized protein n=1 Tax=bioreactor metagenome TaxID=1076179 RepID=A0A645FBQ3_9ZZZZ